MFSKSKPYSNHSSISKIQKRNLQLRAGIYLLKVNNRNNRARCEMCSKLTIKTPELRRPFGVFIVNFEYISHILLVFLLLTLNM